MVGDEFVVSLEILVGHVEEDGAVALFAAAPDEGDVALVALQQRRQQLCHKRLREHFAQRHLRQQRNEPRNERGILDRLDDKRQLHGRRSHFDSGFGTIVERAVHDVRPVNQVGDGFCVEAEARGDLSRALDQIRNAIDKFKDDMDAGKIGPPKLDSDNYPETLEQLVEGVKATGAEDKKIKYLRRIPKDPMTNSTDWGMRSTRDDTDSKSWGGQNVFDVYTKSQDKAKDGTPYSEW